MTDASATSEISTLTDPSELSGATPPEIIDDALNPPTFDVLPLSSETRAGLERMGYTHPTPVQRAVFEPATRGRDLVVQARTGTGKTTAFGLPIIEHLVRRNLKAAQVLVLCPTRELALQVSNELGRLGEGRGVAPVAIYGGAPMGKQIDALGAGAQVVVGTPGRVLDHLKRGTLDASSLRVLVLDEADEMLSMGFERELHAILDLLPRERQTLLFSATLPPDIERMARERLRTPEFVTLSGDAVGALSIAHFVYLITEDKVRSLLKIIEVENPESAIVFCNTKVETEAVAQALTKAGFEADWLNGDLDQAEREAVMARTRKGELRYLVATDVAARGIDISLLTHVINYDFPDTSEAYVHRTGRTGRAGRTGTAISLVRAQDIGNLYLLRLTYKIKPIERQLPTASEVKTRHEADLVQVFIEAYADRGAHPDDIALARRLLSHDRAETVIAGLLRERLGDRPVAEAQAAAARRAKAPAPPPPPRTIPLRAPVAAVAAPKMERSEVPEPSVRPPVASGFEEGPTRRDLRPPRQNDRPREARGSDRGRPPRENDRSRDMRGARPSNDAYGDARRGSNDVRRNEEDNRTARPAVAAVDADASPRNDVAFIESPAMVAAPSTGATHATEPRRPRSQWRSDASTLEGSSDAPVRYYVSPVNGGSEAAQTDPRERPRGTGLSDWHPPEEEGDDKPIFSVTSPNRAGEASEGDEAREEGGFASDLDPQNYAEVFVDIGRRDGARPSDFQKALRERGGISRRETGRIRVRDKHSFVSVRREVITRAIEALEGASIAGRNAHAELAREKPLEAQS